MSEKLPWWRLGTGIAIFATLILVLCELAPVYIDNYRLGRYVAHLTAAENSSPDDVLRSEVLARARQLDLPVQTGDIQIARSGPRVGMHMRYHVMMNLSLYAVDLHMSAP